MRRRWDNTGMTLVEVLIACALAVGLAAAAGAAAPGAIDRARARQAAAFLSSQLEWARAEALGRGRAVGVVFGPDAEGTPVSVHVDGNGNGLRAAEVARGTDAAVSQPRRLDQLFPGVRIGEGTSTGVRLGGGRLLTFSPVGTATPGSIVLTGRDGSRYAVRVSGGTARIRTQRFNAVTGIWSDR